MRQKVARFRLRPKMPGRIPDGWLDYTPLGKPIEGTRFITFKVPLEPGITASLPEEEHFTPSMLVEQIREQGYNLGLIVDLTNTKRYYNSQDLSMLNVKYRKIFTEGKVVPSRKVITEFFSVVDQFVDNEPNANMLIGVHCTHGVNRTGYLVCRYMIDKLGFEPDNALAAYAAGRRYPVERENYIEDLKKGKSQNPLSHWDYNNREKQSSADQHWTQPQQRSWSSSVGRYRDRHRDQDTAQYLRQDFVGPSGPWFTQGYHGQGQGQGHNGRYPQGPPPRQGSYGKRYYDNGPCNQGPRPAEIPRREAGWGASLSVDSGRRSYGHDHSQYGSQSHSKWRFN